MGTIKISKCTTVPARRVDDSCSSNLVFALDNSGLKPVTCSNVKHHFLLCCCSLSTSLPQIFHSIFLYFIHLHSNSNGFPVTDLFDINLFLLPFFISFTFISSSLSNSLSHYLPTFVYFLLLSWALSFFRYIYVMVHFVARTVVCYWSTRHSFQPLTLIHLSSFRTLSIVLFSI
jgi:hypothetical protein